jgi:colicin import membrane protein
MVSLPSRESSPGSGGNTVLTNRTRPKQEKNIKSEVKSEVTPPEKPVPDVLQNKPEPTPKIPEKPEVSVVPQQPEKLKQPDIKPQPDQNPVNAVSLKPKTSLKEKTFKPSKVVKSAIANLEKKAEQERLQSVDRPQSVVDAIARLKSKVTEKMGAEEPIPGKGAGAGAGQGGGGASGGVLSGASDGVLGGSPFGNAKLLDTLNIYQAEVSYHINKNWVFNEQLAQGRTDLAAVLVIKIMPDGEIRDIWFEKKSGNSYFDDSAFKAVKKSSPLPPFPKEYLRPFYNLGLIFTPSGLGKKMY